jgi:hypothetical protein
MAILLTRIKDDNIAVACRFKENPLTNVPVRKLNKPFPAMVEATGSASWRNRSTLGGIEVS